MDKIGLNYDFEHLTPDIFRVFLRELQEKGPYRWPNLYFAWEKDDESLLMVGTNSTQMWQMIVHECNPDDWLNKTHAEYGEPLEYSSVLYGISPNVGYYESGNKRYDPVEKLVQKVSGLKYVGFWRDMDVLMDDPYGYNRVLACGRWELAKEKICAERATSLDAVLSNAEVRADAEKGSSFLDRSAGARGQGPGARDGVDK